MAGSRIGFFQFTGPGLRTVLVRPVMETSATQILDACTIARPSLFTHTR
jgi:hypothetical protein